MKLAKDYQEYLDGQQKVVVGATSSFAAAKVPAPTVGHFPVKETLAEYQRKQAVDRAPYERDALLQRKAELLAEYHAIDSRLAELAGL